MKKKYDQFATRGDVNVSSSGHYFVSVFYGKDGFGHTGHFNLNHKEFVGESGPIKVSKYIVEGAIQAITEALKANKLSFYEYGREGRKRYENLRYHDPEVIEHWLKTQEQEKPQEGAE